MIKEQQELPEGWKWLAIKDLGISLTGNTPPTSNEENYGGQVPFIKPTQLVDKPVSIGLETLSDKGSNIARLLPKGGVLVSCIGNLGKTAIAKTEVAFNQQINAVIFNDLVIPEYGFYCFQTGYFRRKLEELSSATTISIVNKSKFQSINIPIAPLDQQKQIVAKIEELFSHIDAGIEGLKKSKALLKQYRQSVLKAAVTGELTKDWRAENANKIEPASQLLQRSLKERQQRWEQQQLEQFQAKGKMPTNNKWKEKYKEPESISISKNGWITSSLNLFVSIDIGYAFKSKEFTDEGIRLLRGENIEPGALRWLKTRYWPEQRLDEYRKLLIDEGDVILAMDRPIISSGLKIAIAKKSDLPALLVQRVARIKSYKQCLNEFVYLVLNHETFINHCLGNQTGTQLPHISGKQIEDFQIDLPPLEEQKEIVQRVEEKLTAADRLMTELDTKLTQAQQQKQTILASAFKGML